MNSPGEVSSLLERVGDEERDACISMLNGHQARGRLSLEELDRRQDLALVAVTRYDLMVLVADLPGVGAAMESTSARATWASPELWSTAAKATTVGALSAVPVVLSAWLSVSIWEWDNAGAFYGALMGGAAGYGTYAGKARLRALLRRRSD